MSDTPLLRRARPEILALEPYKSARSLYKSAPDTVFLDANECPFAPFPGGAAVARYPDQQPETLVRALCALYDTASRNIVVTRGADEAIDILMRVFCRAGQDNIILCPPTFVMYEQAARIQGAAVRTAPLRADFTPDPETILAQVDENTKLVFICSPNNPTGNLIDPKTIAALCTALHERALVVVDETYIEYAPQDSLIPWIETHPNLLVLRTLSKSFAAAGLRCGAAVAREDIIALMRKVLAPYPLSQPVVETALRILDEKNRAFIVQKRQETLRTKENFIAALQDLSCIVQVYPSDTNFVLIRTKNAAAFVETCRAAGIIVRDQSRQPGLENCVRIAIGAPEEMDRLIATLAGRTDAPATEPQRRVEVRRVTKETAIAATVNLDRVDPVRIETGIGFYDHMLEQVARHGGFSLVLECQGDLDIDTHHTVEDCAIVLGQALREALGDKAGIARYGFTVPMDEALASVALDFSGRFYLAFDGMFPGEHIGGLPADMIAHIFRSLAENMEATCHVTVKGENAHHMAEACFKALGRALRQAVRREGNATPSTKGTL